VCRRDRTAAVNDEIEYDRGEGEGDEHEDDCDHPGCKEALEVLEEASCCDPREEEAADQDRRIDHLKSCTKACEDADQEHCRRADHQGEPVTEVDLREQHQSGEEEEFLEVGDGWSPVETGHTLPMMRVAGTLTASHCRPKMRSDAGSGLSSMP